MEETKKISRLSLSSSTPTLCSETEALQSLENSPPFWRDSSKKRLSKQLSMGSETQRRDIAWEKRRRQRFQQVRKKSEDLTDADLNELKGSIELGFGFNEEEGQRLCNTLPALDLYFAVNRQYSNSPTSPMSSPQSPASAVDSSSSTCFGDNSASCETPGSESANNNSWMICSPGDDPQQVKTKLRHWAQAVACWMLQTH